MTTLALIVLIVLLRKAASTTGLVLRKLAQVWVVGLMLALVLASGCTSPEKKRAPTVSEWIGQPRPNS